MVPEMGPLWGNHGIGALFLHLFLSQSVLPLASHAAEFYVTGTATDFIEMQAEG